MFFLTKGAKMIRKPMKQLFANFENIATRLDINLDLRPQNLSKENILRSVEYMKI